MLQQGSILWVSVSDQSGRNTKCRPAVLVTPTDQIENAKRLVVVAATGTFSKPLPPNRVPLPWQSNPPHPKTGLYKECVAVCDWVHAIEKADIVSIGGVCPQSVLDAILANLQI
ncbi:type II toxin-antitoxin system PemK/MazF family toxin [Thalassoglobus polymorphus]|uniref:type II toxin-antitoxin system PemK/MazF family toxin n=1 Tax=Thalassoglobus polymorphus TaxID=2527994 RepID=UPI0011A466C6